MSTATDGITVTKSGAQAYTARWNTAGKRHQVTGTTPTAARRQAQLLRASEEGASVATPPPRPTPTIATMRAILRAGVASDRPALWTLATLLGMRRGEIAALRWIDVHLDEHELALHVPAGRLGRRCVPLPPAAAVTLRAHYERWAADLDHAPADEDLDDLVFSTTRGGVLSRGFFHHAFAQLAVGTDLQFHDVRRGAIAALLALEVAPVVVAALTDCSTVQIPGLGGDPSQVSEQAKRDAVARLDDHLTRSTTTGSTPQ